MAPTSKREETPDRWINLQPSQNIYPLHDGPGQVPGWQAGSSREAHGNETRPIASHESTGCAQPSLCCQADEPTLRKNVARTMMAWGKASYKPVRTISPPALPAVNTHQLHDCCTRNKRCQNSTLSCNHPLMASLPSVGELSYLNNQQPGIWKRASDSGFCLGKPCIFVSFMPVNTNSMNSLLWFSVFIKRNRRFMLIVSEHFDLCSHLLHSHHLKGKMMPHFSICAKTHTIYR